LSKKGRQARRQKRNKKDGKQLSAVQSDVLLARGGDSAFELVAPYAENLLERTRTQWQFGDWKSLSNLHRDALEHHPERARLAALVAAGHLQLADTNAARHFIRLALKWGCSKKLVGQILVAGVYNSLGRAAAIAGQQDCAAAYFHSSVAVGTPESDSALIGVARTNHQLAQVGGLHAGVPSNMAPVPNQDQTTRLASNPYVHNRTLTPSLTAELCEFGSALRRGGELRTRYVEYLAAKATQLERSCVGRLATTVQDAVARQLVAECVPGERICILEIGALYGIGLALLYNHVISRYKRVKIVSLDPLDGFYGEAVDAVLQTPINDLAFARNMRLANVRRKDYHLIKHLSTEKAAIDAARRLKTNLLVIDGDHSYEGVKFDFETYFPLLEPGGYVIFDDYNAKEWPGVTRFIDDDLRYTPEVEYLGTVSRTVVVRKKATATA
jgi:cephalosporin hydroxylase